MVFSEVKSLVYLYVLQIGSGLFVFIDDNLFVNMNAYNPGQTFFDVVEPNMCDTLGNQSAC